MKAIALPAIFSRYKVARLWLAVGGLLVGSLLPCPECGTPLAWHLWPVLGGIALLHTLRRRFKQLPGQPPQLEADSLSRPNSPENINGSAAADNAE